MGICKVFKTILNHFIYIRWTHFHVLQHSDTFHPTLSPACTPTHSLPPCLIFLFNFYMGLLSVPLTVSGLAPHPIKNSTNCKQETATFPLEGRGTITKPQGVDVTDIDQISGHCELLALHQENPGVFVF